MKSVALGAMPQTDQAATPIQPGELDVDLTVNVVYAIE